MIKLEVLKVKFRKHQQHMKRKKRCHYLKVEMYVCICRGDSFVVLHIKNGLSEKGGNERDRTNQSFKA